MTDTPATTTPISIGAAVIGSDRPAPNTNTLKSYRAVAGEATTADNLGPLKDLPGFWAGTGFSVIARPDFSAASENGFFLQLNLLRETIEFTTIGSPVMNRGSLQDDIALYGVTYLHRVTNAVTGGALHIEPGVWLNVPATSDPKADASIVRLSTIPHGNAVCASGFVQEVVPQGLPDIPPANTIPFKEGGQPPPAGSKNPYAEYDLSQDSNFRTTPLPDGITQAILDDPNEAVRQALTGQTLNHITRLITSTAAGGSVANIPFVVQNANTISLESVFAIEVVEGPLDSEFLQLQYSQTALLNFGGTSFPHVTVGTLIKAF
jgi:hypothetical protein